MCTLITWAYLCFRQWRRVINGAGFLWHAAGPFSEISKQSAVLTAPLPQRSVIMPLLHCDHTACVKFSTKIMYESKCVFPSSSHYTANSIKVELFSDDESPGAPQPENREPVRDDSRKDGRGEPMEEANAEFTAAGRDRGSIYSEMASPNAASPGPIRLPNGKLQCEVCGMICIGPNVLMVHKRSHTGENKLRCICNA